MDKVVMQKELDYLEAKVASLKKALEGDPAQKAEPEKKVEAAKKAVPAKEAVDAKKENVIESLDDIATTLESQNDPELTKIAYQIDTVADMLEGKTAYTISGDGDEPYMKEHFKAGLREGDADEKKYMNEFNTDFTVDVEEVRKGLTSADLPYQAKKDLHLSK